MGTSRHWHLRGSPGHAYSGPEARSLLRGRLDWATHETWFEDGRGSALGVVTNGERALVVLTDGGRSEHLVDPRGEGTSGGYPLANGQVDVHADRDTVAFDVAQRAVAHFIEHAAWPDDVQAEDD